MCQTLYVSSSEKCRRAGILFPNFASGENKILENIFKLNTSQIFSQAPSELTSLLENHQMGIKS